MEKRTTSKTMPKTKKATTKQTRAERAAKRHSTAASSKSTKARAKKKPTTKKNKKNKPANASTPPEIPQQSAITALSCLKTAVARTEWQCVDTFTGDRGGEVFSAVPGDILTDKDGSTFVFNGKQTKQPYWFDVTVQNDVNDSTMNGKHVPLGKEQDHLRPIGSVVQTNAPPATPAPSAAVPPPTTTTTSTTPVPIVLRTPGALEVSVGSPASPYYYDYSGPPWSKDVMTKFRRSGLAGWKKIKEKMVMFVHLCFVENCLYMNKTSYQLYAQRT
jgi:hypothetical protein